VSSSKLFESHRWRLYETRQANRLEEQTVEVLRKHKDGRCQGWRTWETPDSNGDVARGMPDLMEGVARQSESASAGGHSNTRWTKQRERGQESTARRSASVLWGTAEG